MKSVDQQISADPKPVAIVVIPAYQEQQTISDTVAAIARLKSCESTSVSLRIFVVDDGSTDGTGDAAAEAGADRVLRHRRNRGLGAAVRTGLAAARAEGADIVVKIDGDGQHDPEDVLAVMQPILNDEADIVYGNRVGRISYRVPVIRRWGNWVFTRIMSWLTGWQVRDGQPGILAVGKAYLDRFHLPGDYNYTQQLLLDAFHKGMRFEHVPVTFKERQSGRSFVTLRYPFRVLSQIVLVILGLNPMRIFGPVGILMLLAAATVFAIDLFFFFTGESPKPAQHANFILGTSLFGLQTLLFGLLADLIIRQQSR